MTRIKLLLVGLVLAGLLCTYLPSAVFAMPLTQIEEGEKCRRLNEIIEEGFWRYKCTKVRKKKLWQLNGISSTSTSSTTTTTTTTIPPTTTVPSAPPAPSGLVLTIKSPFDGTGTISWTDNSNNEENFYVSNIDPAKLGSTPLTSIWFKGKADSTSVGVTGYQNGYNYCYWVMASNSIGNSAWTGPACTLAGTATTTTTVYVPPTSVSIPPTSGSSVSSFSISGYVGSSNVSLTSSWSSLFERYSTSGYVGNSYVSLTSSWSSLFQRYSTSGYVDNSYVSLTSSWSSLFQRYSTSGYVGNSYVSLTSSWSSLFQRYSTSGYVGNSYVSATSSWSSLFQRYSISGSGSSMEAAILATVIFPPK